MSDMNPTGRTLSHIEVVLQYTLSKRLLESKDFDDLAEAHTILTELESTVGEEYPMIYSALVEFYIKASRFKKAERILAKAFSTLERKETTVECFSPGTNDIIPESSKTYLIQYLLNLQKQCTIQYPSSTCSSSKSSEDIENDLSEAQDHQTIDSHSTNAEEKVCCQCQNSESVIEAHKRHIQDLYKKWIETQTKIKDAEAKLAMDDIEQRKVEAEHRQKILDHQFNINSNIIARNKEIINEEFEVVQKMQKYLLATTNSCLQVNPSEWTSLIKHCDQMKQKLDEEYHSLSLFLKLQENFGAIDNISLTPINTTSFPRPNINDLIHAAVDKLSDYFMRQTSYSSSYFPRISEALNLLKLQHPDLTDDDLVSSMQMTQKYFGSSFVNLGFSGILEEVNKLIYARKRSSNIY